MLFVFWPSRGGRPERYSCLVTIRSGGRYPPRVAPGWAGEGHRDPGDREGVSYLLKCWGLVGLGGCEWGFDEEKEEGYEWM